MDNTDKAVFQWLKSDDFDDIDNTNDEGRTALQEAIYQNYLLAFHYLLEQSHLEMVKALIQAGINIDASCEYQGETGRMSSLHIATISGHLPVVQALIQAGANPNAENEDDETALDLADAEEHEDVVAYLESLS